MICPIRFVICWEIRALSLLPVFPKEECRGIFIAENAHRCRNPTLHLQGKCSSWIDG